MIITTARYADWRPSLGMPVRITLGKPRWPEPTGRAQWIYLAEAAPRGWFFRAARPKYEACLNSQMNRLTADLLAKLSWLTGEYGAVCLCCFCDLRKPDTWCHRRQVARWLEERVPGLQVPEAGRG